MAKTSTTAKTKTKAKGAQRRIEDAERDLAAAKKLEARVGRKLSGDARRARKVKKSIKRSQRLLASLDERLAQAEGARKSARKELRELRG